MCRPPIDLPSHGRCLEVEIDLGAGRADTTANGADLSHEHVNGDAEYQDLDSPRP